MSIADHSRLVLIERAIEEAVAAQGFRTYRTDGHAHVTLRRLGDVIDLSRVAREVRDALAEKASR